ncbi:MAG TPA: hypothetical protein VN634_02290 [Candidatus Limnocylindrales bacterium]|nr:hypothetical protein [Candidatus Limnocylindrales bacterium]
MLPDDVAIPNGFGGNPIEFFDDFSWRSFIALNWPAQTPGPAGATRGVADAAAAFGDTTKPLLWESWKTDWEMIPGANCLGDAAGCAIRPWNEMGENPCGTPSSPDTKVLAAFSTFENLAQAGFGNLEGPIVDQGKHYARFEIHVNRPTFEPIFQRKLFLRANLPTPANPVVFADGAGGNPHSVLVKAAWRDLTGLAPEKRARFLVRSALVFDPVALTCAQRDVGLVGFHILQKTISRPQWIWSTFEHVDNIPESSASAPGEVKGEAPFSFNDGAGSPKSPKTTPLSATNLPVDQPNPTQILREKKIHASTGGTNALYQNAPGVSTTVFRFYRLVMTQWPVVVKNPDGTEARGVPANTFPGAGSDQTAFSNSVIETFRQKPIVNGCMNCHDLATQDASSDFVWFLTTRAIPAVGSPAPAPPAVAGGTLGLAPAVVEEPRLDGLEKLMKEH